MKITELVGIKNKIKSLPKASREGSHPHGVEWHKIMRDNGFETAGRGYYATVWSHPKLSYVLKLFKADDQAYIDWLSVVMKNQNNPHMPKIISTKLVPITKEISAIRMEPLRRIFEDELIDIHNFSDNLLNGINLPSISMNEFKDINYQYPKVLLFNNYCENHPQWLKTLDILYEFMKSTKHNNDFHPGNCLVRNPDTLVITDPVSGS
jgi:hypothetical protein